MPDFYQKLTDMQGGLEDLIRKVPGFKGYFEKEDRRMADRLLREHIVTVFNEHSTEFTRLQRRLIDNGGIMYMERVQGIDSQLRTFINRVESAAEGYAGLLDAVKIQEEELANVYSFDNALLAYQDQLLTGLSEFEGAIGTDAVGDVLYQLDDLLTEMNDTFKRRSEAMQGLQDSV